MSIANIKRYAMRDINLKHMEQQEEPKSILREIMFGKTPEPEPWSITFSWKNEAVKIKFKNGEDILKLAEVFSQYLTANGIENTLEKQ